jgi:hypothetical protein
MPETTPPAPSKSFLLSRTIWLQILLFALAFFPPALAWLKANPVEAVAVIGAANVLLRFITSGKISILPPEDQADGTGGAAGGRLPLWVVGLGMAAGIMGCLPSCSALEGVPVRFTLITPEGDVGYSSKAGLSVDYRSGK